MEKLSLTRLGRILLHLIAMLGDRQVIWHLHGIQREVEKD